MLKKFLAILLATVLVLLTGCSAKEEIETPNGQNENGAPAKQSQIQLLYCANDTFNPYKTISKLNAELSYLLFEPLFKVDNNFNSLPVIAENIKTEGNTHTVTIKDVVFSDGTKLTADDVLYSYNLAKESNRFSATFYEVQSVVAADSKTIVFTLSQNDPYFSNLLTFPIIKIGSDNLKNEDNVEIVPIGCGPFIFTETGDKLIPNEKYFNKVTSISEIRLINAPDNESMEHYVEVGATDLYYAQMVGDSIIRMSGKKVSVNLNNLIYLGINHNYAPLKSEKLRFAISSAISRAQIAEKTFYYNATPANGFFHPTWSEVSDFQTMQSSADLKISVENLNDIGYNILNTDGYLENASGKILELTLLVNGENAEKVATAELIKAQLKAAGIMIKINAVSSAQFYSSLRSGGFQLYLGEVKLLPNMDISSLVLNGGSAAYGMINPTSYTSEEGEEDQTYYSAETAYVSVVKSYLKGESPATAVASALLSSMPVIPLVYRNSIAFYSNQIEDITDISSCDVFLWLDKYKATK